MLNATGAGADVRRRSTMSAGGESRWPNSRTATCKPESCQRPARPSRLRGARRAYLHLGRELAPRPDTLTQTEGSMLNPHADGAGHTLTIEAIAGAPAIRTATLMRVEHLLTELWMFRMAGKELSMRLPDVLQHLVRKPVVLHETAFLVTLGDLRGGQHGGSSDTSSAPSAADPDRRAQDLTPVIESPGCRNLAVVT
jgi:hypothetical protein